ncbi:MAG: trypsin-like peptidase domain-containing protein [Phycisphaerales bacterium]
MLLSVGVAFLAGMAAAIMTGNALLRAQADAAADAERERLARAAQTAQAELDADDFQAKLNAVNRRVAAAVEPSVVHLQVSRVVLARSRGGRSIRQLEQGSGSGWVYDAAGHIVTNAHVVGDSPAGEAEDGRGGEGGNPGPGPESRIIVHFSNGTSYPARVVGIDAPTDIAVLAVDKQAPLVPARRATNEEVHQGDRVYAFGSPFGFRFSMSQGLISGLSRDPSDASRRDTYTNYLQTDAAVNPGNSGGPLCDVRGRVVGMNVAIAAETLPQAMVVASRGVGFAIPLTTIEPIVDQLIAHGHVFKGFLGVNMPESDERNEAALRARGFNGTGVLLTGVVAAAPAELAGLRVGDIITALDGTPVRSVSQLRTIVATRRPGDQMSVRLLREGQTQMVSITLADLEASIGAQDAVAAALQEFGISQLTAGVPLTIDDVEPASRAREMGLSRGTVIEAVNGRPVRDMLDLLGVLAAAKFHEGRAVEATLSRGGVQRTITIQMPTSK